MHTCIQCSSATQVVEEQVFNLLDFFPSYYIIILYNSVWVKAHPIYTGLFKNAIGYMYSIYTWAYIHCILLKLITVQKSTDILYWGLYTHFSTQVSRIWKSSIGCNRPIIKSKPKVCKAIFSKKYFPSKHRFRRNNGNICFILHVLN